MINYNLELKKVALIIKKEKAKKVLIQLPDGLKPKTKEINNFLKKEFENKKNNIIVFFWAGSCFGACDTPEGLKKLDMDLLIQFGHSEWE
jgi:2-(3-amino-3-carboxypropyl)histidine synthase